MQTFCQFLHEFVIDAYIAEGPSYRSGGCSHSQTEKRIQKNKSYRQIPQNPPVKTPLAVRL